ncbi:glycosyltransferase [Sphingomonas sp. SRS2]|uniref:glycosyltransferase n=1 Tax=Sphingomonas sp. SRS2 TaxID=133190 RepID=UPI0006966484|nr:glycosyltransferase [Sphingomonas sp. SRS2]
MNQPTDRPTVSVIVACFNAAGYLRASVRSALDQSLREIEVIIIDDGSTDDSASIARELAAADRRVRLHLMERNGGPAAARNRGFDLARGRFVAILDSDDLYHPERLKRLVTICDAVDADMIADDMIIFDDENRSAPTFFFRYGRAANGAWVTLAGYFRESVLYGRHPNLGFLKPLIRLDLIRDHGIRYDESLRIAEDDELVIQLLRAGARYRTVAEAGYFYRKHGSSTSHRLSLVNVEAMVMAGARLAADLRDAPADIRNALARRNRALRNTRDFTLSVQALKARRPGRAAALAISRPGLLPLFGMPVASKVKRLFSRSGTETINAGPPRACVISNQRLVGATNGSSAYLIDLARSTRAAGHEPHLVQPSPALFGRTPFFRLRPEMKVFASHKVHGAMRIGDWMVARDPRVWGKAAIGIVRRMARRFGVEARWTIDRPAPYAITAPWTKADQLFVTAHARPNADIVIADYMFLARALPYVARPNAPSAIVMHDLFHARSGGFAATGDRDSVAGISRDGELALLGKADAVIAIQAAEADFITRALPDRMVILAPMAAQPVDAPQPGDAGRLLFVGSNTAPNVHGLRWFIDQVWPQLRAARPELRLDVAGSVAAAFPQAAPGVIFHGMVDDLAVLYRDAGVVISPLLHGSGLKIKLIEALAHGKAVVATGVTLQGVEDTASHAVLRADNADDFARAILGLTANDAPRAALAAQAIEAARVHFSPAICYQSFRDWLAGTPGRQPPHSNEEARLCA